ncbi:Protein ALP1-like, partial [Pseudolycoriella hygida]
IVKMDEISELEELSSYTEFLLVASESVIADDISDGVDIEETDGQTDDQQTDDENTDVGQTDDEQTDDERILAEDNDIAINVMQCIINLIELEYVLQDQSPNVRRKGKPTGDALKGLHYNFRVGISTAYNIIRETCDALWDVLQPIYLKFPEQEDWIRIEEQFRQKLNFPNCVGAMDGKLIEIFAPGRSGSLYFNYNKYFSTNLLAICDALKNFIYVDIGSYGQQTDGGVLFNSTFGKRMDMKKLNFPPSNFLPHTSVAFPYFIIADSAFPLRENLLTPYAGDISTLSDIEANFNREQSSCRKIIENSFGILVRRWQILSGPIEMHPINAHKILKATLVLHNYIKSFEDPAAIRYMREERCTYPQTESLRSFYESGIRLPIWPLDEIEFSQPTSMPIYCAVPECTTIGTNGLHRFPTTSERRQVWMEKTRTLYLGPKENAKICRKHFKASDLLIDIDGKLRLAPNAVPCLFLPGIPTLHSDHNYCKSILSTKKNKAKLLKASSMDISNDNIGNEVEIGGLADQVRLGPCIDLAYLRSLESKLLKITKCTHGQNYYHQGSSKSPKRIHPFNMRHPWIIKIILNTNSDGLENFFGCLKTCCQIACTMTPRQF